MTDEEKIAAEAEVNAKQKSLEFLFDYTKFHIGLYLTLTGSYLTVATASINGQPLLKLKAGFFWPAIVAFMVAGIAGGVIASSITQTEARSSREFLDKLVGPWDWKRIHFLARNWTYIEHTFFWVGLVLAVLSFRP